jgi:hypothetical protein
MEAEGGSKRPSRRRAKGRAAAGVTDAPSDTTHVARAADAAQRKSGRKSTSSAKGDSGAANAGGVGAVVLTALVLLALAAAGWYVWNMKAPFPRHERHTQAAAAPTAEPRAKVSASASEADPTSVEEEPPHVWWFGPIFSGGGTTRSRDTQQDALGERVQGLTVH